jgi:hypothetical protein
VPEEEEKEEEEEIKFVSCDLFLCISCLKEPSFEIHVSSSD